jgi:hypothetical protein
MRHRYSRQPKHLRSHLPRRALLIGAASLAAFAPSARAAERVKIRDLWGDGGAFSPLAESLKGTVIELRGYMAAPLKPEVNFFVLTRIPTAVCPFCDSEASWPQDLVLVYSARPLEPVPFNDLIRVTGRLDLGTQTDAATGFVSRVRLTEADFAIA